MDEVMTESMGEPMEESMSESPGRYIPKQFDLDKLRSIEDEELKGMLYGLMVSESSMFREETRTTLETYGLIIDQREGNINQILND